jgi:hypothetical protein
MWGRRRKSVDEAKPEEAAVPPLKEALRQARIEAAEHTGVVVDLRDAEIARLELLNEALDPLFAQVPDSIDLFDRGISRGEPPRLWLDVVAHVDMGRDKRTYRLIQDSRYGRKVLAESTDVPVIVDAITKYAARRMIERERALSADERLGRDGAPAPARRARTIGVFLLGMIVGMAGLIAAAWIIASRLAGP